MYTYTITEVAKKGLLLNQTTGKSTHSRTQVYNIMRKLGVNKLTEQTIEDWNERVESLHSAIIH